MQMFALMMIRSSQPHLTILLACGTGKQERDYNVLGDTQQQVKIKNINRKKYYQIPLIDRVGGSGGKTFGS